MTGPLQSFGRASKPTWAVLQPVEAIARLTGRRTAAASLLAYGNGRSYGDTCQNAAAALIDMRSSNGIFSFDPETAVLEAEAGVLLSDIIAAVAQQGFFPAVVPGTRFVTLGGAIANDIHGKNHHLRGSFGCHVEWLRLLRSDGAIYRCSKSENAALFGATIGGMGLTGLILSAAIRLMPVASLDVEETATGFDDLDGYFRLAAEADARNEYAVAWIDQLAQGDSLGRGVLLTGNHLKASREVASPARTLTVPFQPPVTVLNRPMIGVFNRAYRWSKLRVRGPKPASWQSFFFPLDGVRNWNRLYGPRGLYQHQSVIPFDAAPAAVRAMLEVSQRAGQASFLTVLKRFGEVKSPALLSFPRPGYTLTLDFPNRGVATLDLLAELDSIATGAGGAVNPYKDARMSAQTFAASFPQWQRLEKMRDPAFVSDFWRRTALTLPAAGTRYATAAE